jgi:hypothetical protein
MEKNQFEKEISMAEPAIQLVETTEVETKAVSIVDQAKAVKVVDSDTYPAAGTIWKSIGDMIKEVKDTFDPIVSAAHHAHKQATEKRAKFLDPLTAAQKSVKQLMGAYDAEQERIRRAEEARLAEIARREEEERRLQEAIAAEKEARANGATKEEAAQEAQSIVDEPVYVPPVVVPKATPKMAGGPVYRTIWRFRIKDVNLIPRQYMVPNETAIGGVVRSLKGTTNIPGIEVYEERV